MLCLIHEQNQHFPNTVAAKTLTPDSNYCSYK